MSYPFMCLTLLSPIIPVSGFEKKFKEEAFCDELSLYSFSWCFIVLPGTGPGPERTEKGGWQLLTQECCLFRFLFYFRGTPFPQWAQILM